MKDTLDLESRGYSEWLALINEHIFNERDRRLLARHLLDGVPLNKCGAEIGLEWRQTQRRYNRAVKQLARHS